MRKVLVVWSAAGVLAAAGCATSPPARLERSGDLGSAAQQPFRDLNLVRDEIPEVLQRAVTAPYAVDRPASCADLEREIAALDPLLGPDVDQPGRTMAAMVRRWRRDWCAAWSGCPSAGSSAI